MIHSTRPPRRRARWPLSLRASDHQIERTDEVSTGRSAGCTEAVQFFLDEYAAVLAALVDLTAARKRLDGVVASFTDHAYSQDAGDRGAKGETAKQRQLRVNLRGQQMAPIALIARISAPPRSSPPCRCRSRRQAARRSSPAPRPWPMRRRFTRTWATGHSGTSKEPTMETYIRKGVAQASCARGAREV